MACIHCGGHHESDLCHGFNSYSMSKSLTEISSGIDLLSEFNERALDEISDKYSDIISSQEKIAESNENVANNIYTAGNKISDNIANTGKGIADAINTSTSINSSGYKNIFESINKAGINSMTGNIISGLMISSALVGIGAILKHRERMEQLRHTERMSFEEETSVSGKARRELITATSLLFAGDLNQAENHIKNSLKIFPSSAETFRVRSIIESKKEEHNEAIISLKTAIALAEEKYLFPSILNIDGSINDELYEKVISSSLAQISQELAITNNLKDALQYLNDGVDRFPNNSDLQFQRIRILNKSEQWDKYFEDYIFKLIHLSPQHFNIIYTDLQLTKRKNEIQNYLKSVKQDKGRQLQNKLHALTMLSEGTSQYVSSFNNTEIQDFGFSKIFHLLNMLTQEIKNTIKSSKD